MLWYDVHVDVCTGNGVPADQPQRDHTGPHATGRHVELLVVGVAGTCFDRGLVQGQGQHGGGGQLLGGRPAQVGGPPGGRVLDKQVEGVRPLVGIGDQAGPPDHHGGAVVHRVVE